MVKNLGLSLGVISISFFTWADIKKASPAPSIAPSKPGSSSPLSAKAAFGFPDTSDGQIVIQTGADKFEVLTYKDEGGVAFAQSCEVQGQKRCLAHEVKPFVKASPKELSEKCKAAHGEPRIARRHGVQRITSVCYFKEDKSFVEFD